MANEETTDPALAAMSLRERMAAEGKQSYVVTYRQPNSPENQDSFLLQFWATDPVDARRQFNLAVTSHVYQVRIETQVTYEARTGNKLTFEQMDHN